MFRNIFPNWTRSDTLVSYDSIYNFNCGNNNDTLTANYAPFSYNLDLLVVPTLSGFVTGEGTYAYGDIVTINASPALGFEFVGWFNDNQLVSTDNEYTFPMPFNDLEYTAVFDSIFYEIAVASNNPAFGETFGGGSYNYGDTVTLLAIPNTGYSFIAWTENGQVVSVDPEYSLQAYSDHNFIGNFELVICLNPFSHHPTTTKFFLAKASANWSPTSPYNVFCTWS